MFMLQNHQSLQLVSCMSSGFALGFCLKKVKVHRTGNPTRRRLWRISCWCAPELPTVPTVQCTVLFLSTNAEFHVVSRYGVPELLYMQCFADAFLSRRVDCHIVWCWLIWLLFHVVSSARGRACQSWSDASYVEGQPTCWMEIMQWKAVSSYTCSDSVCVVPRSSKVRISTRLNGCKILSWYFACVLGSMGCLLRL